MSILFEDKNLDAGTPSSYSRHDLRSPLSMDRPRALNKGCSGLHQKKKKELMKQECEEHLYTTSHNN